MKSEGKEGEWIGKRKDKEKEKVGEEGRKGSRSKGRRREEKGGTAERKDKEIRKDSLYSVLAVKT